MQQLVPDRVPREESLGGDPEQLLHVGAHRERRAAELGRVGVDGAGHLLEQRRVGGFGLIGAALCLAQARLEIGGVFHR